MELQLSTFRTLPSPTSTDLLLQGDPVPKGNPQKDPLGISSVKMQAERFFLRDCVNRSPCILPSRVRVLLHAISEPFRYLIDKLSKIFFSKKNPEENPERINPLPHPDESPHEEEPPLQNGQDRIEQEDRPLEPLTPPRSPEIEGDQPRPISEKQRVAVETFYCLPEEYRKAIFDRVILEIPKTHPILGSLPEFAQTDLNNVLEHYSTSSQEWQAIMDLCDEDSIFNHAITAFFDETTATLDHLYGCVSRDELVNAFDGFLPLLRDEILLEMTREYAGFYINENEIYNRMVQIFNNANYLREMAPFLQRYLNSPLSQGIPAFTPLRQCINNPGLPDGACRAFAQHFRDSNQEIKRLLALETSKIAIEDHIQTLLNEPTPQECLANRIIRGQTRLVSEDRDNEDVLAHIDFCAPKSLFKSAVRRVKERFEEESSGFLRSLDASLEEGS